MVNIGRRLVVAPGKELAGSLAVIGHGLIGIHDLSFFSAFKQDFLPFLQSRIFYQLVGRFGHRFDDLAVP